MTQQDQFSLEDRGNYIHLVTRGKLDVSNLEAPADAALALAKRTKITRLLDDIRYIDSSGVSIPIQVKGFGIIWKLRRFKKVAIIFKEKEIGRLLLRTLEAMHIHSSFKGFDNEAEAVQWLQEDDK